MLLFSKAQPSPFTTSLCTDMLQSTASESLSDTFVSVRMRTLRAVVHGEEMSIMSERTLAVAQINEARNYTKSILETIPETDWLTFPSGCASNIAWQVGHLAMASYRLGLERIRGHRSADDFLIPPEFLDRYGKGSIPDSTPEKNYPLKDIRLIFDAVHEKLLEEQGEWSDEFLQGEVIKSHRLFSRKWTPFGGVADTKCSTQARSDC